MTLAQSLLPEFDQEMGSTRKLLELVGKADPTWKPHPRSFSLGDLSLHIANLVSWGATTMKTTELDLNPPGGPGWTPPVYESPAATLKVFDTNVEQSRAALTAASDADMMTVWTLKNGGQALFSMPRVACMRSFVLNHLIHHRGQLTVYLRLQDVPLPSVYGPTADAPL